MSVLCAVMAGISWTRARRIGDDECDMEIEIALRRKRQPFLGGGTVVVIGCNCPARMLEWQGCFPATTLR
jgi:hypothetical protein